jgi:hypothetical protein
LLAFKYTERRKLDKLWCGFISIHREIHCGQTAGWIYVNTTEVCNDLGALVPINIKIKIALSGIGEPLGTKIRIGFFLKPENTKCSRLLQSILPYFWTLMSPMFWVEGCTLDALLRVVFRKQCNNCSPFRNCDWHTTVCVRLAVTSVMFTHTVFYLRTALSRHQN